MLMKNQYNRLLKANKLSDLNDKGLFTANQIKKVYVDVITDESVIPKKVLKEVIASKDNATLLTQIANSQLISTREASEANRKTTQQYIGEPIKELADKLEIFNDEIQRKNNLDEYYMLLDKIEEYENILIEWGCFDEAYEKVNVKEIPHICLSDCEMKVLLGLDANIIKECLNICKNIFVSPLEIMPYILYKHKVIGWTEPLSKVRYSLQKDIEEISKHGWNFYKNLIIKDCDELIKNNYKLGYEEIISFKYKLIKENIEKINSDISMKNAKSLYFSIKQVVREMKIQKFSKN